MSTDCHIDMMWMRRDLWVKNTARAVVLRAQVPRPHNQEFTVTESGSATRYPPYSRSAA
jgi:hypothetical protein